MMEKEESSPKKAYWVGNLALILLTTVATVGGIKFYLNNKDHKPTTEVTHASKGKKTYDMGKLEGRKFGYLFSWYTGIKGLVHEQEEIDFEAQLNAMWTEKLENYPGNKTVIRQFIEGPVAGYDLAKATKMPLKQYRKLGDKNVDLVNDNLDWKIVKELTGVSQERLDVAKKIANTMNGRILLGYALTEVMASKDGELNTEVLNFELEKAGREYVELSPAMADPRGSGGLFQFTSDAICGIKGKERGASLINLALPKEYRIPGSVLYLKGDDHFKAAQLLMIANTVEFVKKISNRQLKTLKKIDSGDAISIAEYIAATHHNPKYALKCAKEWLNDGMKKEYKEYCENVKNGSYEIRLKDYTEKTSINYKALGKY